MITGYLHIPGGVGTSFSLMFLTVACVTYPYPGAGALMGFVQSIIAVMMGKSGSMGAMAPIGYIVPGIVMDLVIIVCRKMKTDEMIMTVMVNVFGAVTACLFANLIVFRLSGIVLLLYVLVSMLTGSIAGTLAYVIAKRIKPIINEK